MTRVSTFVPVEKIDPSPWADLFPHEDEDIARLQADIEARGIQTPLHAFPRGDRFELLAGHDRLEAAKRAGLTEVPVAKRSTLSDEDDRFEYFLKDNTLRKSVDKRAVAKAAWLRWPDSKVQDIAKRAGVSYGTAHEARPEDVVNVSPDIQNERGQIRPRTYAPREPAAGDNGSEPKPESDDGPTPSPAPPATEPRGTTGRPGDGDDAVGAGGQAGEADDDGNRLAVHHSSETQEWYTPQHIIDAVLDVLGGIDLDPCSNPGEPAVPAGHHHTYLDNGLAQTWSGRVYMNPPYGRGIGDWTEKLREAYEAGDVTEAVALLPARTDTAWMHDLREHPRCFIRGRISFSGHENAAPFPSCAVYFGERADAFARAFGELGDTYALMET